MLISVIICTYNRAALLQTAIQSVCEQSLDQSQYEVLIIDNHSTDTTRLVVEAFFERWPNVRYFFEATQGLAYARNRGWQEAKGEYVAYLDDDGKAPPAWLQVAQQIIEQQAPLEFGGPFLAYYTTPKPSWWRDPYDANHSGGTERAAGYLPPKLYAFGGNLFLQRAIFRQLGGFDPTFGMRGDKLAYGEESELHERLCALWPGHRAYFEPTLYVYHLVRPEKLSLWWQLRSIISHGQAGYAIAPHRYRPFTRREHLLFPLDALKRFGVTLWRSWFRRDRARHPAWQNYLYEDQQLYACLHRLGNWVADTQKWLNLAPGKRGRHDA